MAREDRTATDAVAFQRALERKPYAFHYFQALRRLETLYRHQPRIGESLRPADDPVRLGQDPSLIFAPSTIARFQPGMNGRPARMFVHFFGSFGPNGPLPLHLTEYARDRLRNADDPTFARFLDIFHHRLLSLFYRAWAKAEPAVQYDRPEEDRFGDYVASLCGYGVPSLRKRDAMPDLAKWHFAARLANHVKNPEGLQAILSTFFGVPARVVEFIGHWMELPADCRLHLGRSPEIGTLGMTATIGSRVWDCQNKFRIVVGPMSLRDYERLLPGGDGLTRLVAIVRNYLGDELVWDANLILRKEEVPQTSLGRAGQLGRTAWLIGRQPDHDTNDLMLEASRYTSSLN